MPPVSVTIITLNESAHIAAAIDSAAWADEIVVVDSGSTDDTVALARGLGARVFAREWSGYIDQKNHAAALASHDWIFSLDADERITPALASEIRQLLRGEPAHRGYRVPRRAGWDTVSILAHSMTVSEAQRFPSIHAWLKEFRAAGGTPGKRPPGAPIPKVDVSRLSTANPLFWRAYFEITPGDSGAMLLHAGLLLAAGEVSRAAYVLIAARQSEVARLMRRTPAAWSSANSA